MVTSLKVLARSVRTLSHEERIRTYRDNLTSQIEVSETRISKELRDESDRQVKEDEEMENR